MKNIVQQAEEHGMYKRNTQLEAARTSMASNTKRLFRDSKQPEHFDAYDGDTEDTRPSKRVKRMHEDLLESQDFTKSTDVEMTDLASGSHGTDMSIHAFRNTRIADEMLTAPGTSTPQVSDSVHTEMRPLDDEGWDSQQDAEGEPDDEYLSNLTAAAPDNEGAMSVASEVSDISELTDFSDVTEHCFPIVKHRRDAVEGDPTCACEGCGRARSEMLDEIVVRPLE